MQVSIELVKLRALEADLANTQQALMQTQQMMLTIIFAQPDHCVTLQPEDFDALPNRPAASQFVDEASGAVTISVADAGEAADYGH